MAWTDNATDKQFSALYWMLNNHLMPDEVKARMDWIKEQKPSRKSMSEELGRIRKLCSHGNSLVTSESDLAVWFDSPIWSGFSK